MPVFDTLFCFHLSHSAIQIASQNWGGPHVETLPNFNYDAPDEVCGDRKLFNSPLQ